MTGEKSSENSQHPTAYSSPTPPGIAVVAAIVPLLVAGAVFVPASIILHFWPKPLGAIGTAFLILAGAGSAFAFRWAWGWFEL